MRYFTILLVFINASLYPQQQKIDSLLTLMDISNDSTKVGVLLALSEQHNYHDFEKASLYAHQAMNLAATLGRKEDEILSLYKLGTLSFHKKVDTSSIKYLDKGIKKAKANNDNFLIAEGYYHLSKFHEVEGNFPKALDFINRALKIYKALNKQREEASCYSSIGHIYNNLSNYEKALELYFKALRIYETLNNKNGQAIIFTNIGNIYLQTSNFDDASDYFLKAMAIDKESNDREGILVSFLNLGVAQQKMANYNTAITYFEEALIIARELNLRFDEAILMGNMGATFRSQKKYEESLSYLLDALGIKKELKKWRSVAHTYNDISETYLEMGNLLEAKRYASEAIAVPEGADLNQLREAYNLLAKSSYRLGNLDAYTYQQKGNSIKDSIFSIEANAKMDELEIAYQTSKKEDQIINLTAQNKAAEFKRRSYLAGSVMVSMVLLLLFNQQRLKTRKNRELLKKEKEVERMKSQFFANISHEFRTPLTLILGPIESMQSLVKDPKMSYNLDVMKKNAGKLLFLINQLLDLSKLEAGKLKLEVVKNDVVPIIRGVTMAFHSMAEIKEIELHLTTDTDYLEAYFDKEKLETIMVNLLSNAFKFTPPKEKIGVQFSGNEMNKFGKCYTIGISDTGRGIPLVDLPHIFNRFYRSSQVREKLNEGTGIGLALTKELVELHRGTITVESKVDRGTKIVVQLPVDRIQFQADEITAKVRRGDYREDVLINNLNSTELQNSTIDTDQAKPMLLLVEDNEDVMRYIKDVFQDDYTVLEAIDGEEGIDMALEQVPDMIISDVMMPKKDGYEVCNTLKKDERTSHIPIILLTAKASLQNKIEGLETQADDYVIKPFVPQELKLRVKNLIASRKKLQEKYKHEMILKPSEITVNSVDQSFLENIMNVVEDNIGNEEFSVEQLGQIIGMSRSQLHRKLKALLDQAPNQFIRSFRLRRAHNLLSQNAASTSEIAYQVGFGSPSYFTKCFREQYGYTPSDVQN